MPRPWTTQELTTLADYAHEGADEVSKRTGRSASAVINQAHRCGISLAKTWVCPNCSKTTHRPLMRHTGWCQRCSAARSVELAKIRGRKLALERLREGREVKALEKERNRYDHENYVIRGEMKTK